MKELKKDRIIKPTIVLVTLLFIALKVFNVVDWSWLIILSPILAFVLLAIMAAISVVNNKEKRELFEELKNRIEESEKTGDPVYIPEVKSNPINDAPIMKGTLATIIGWGTLLLIILKLSGAIEWSWWLVLGFYIAKVVYNFIVGTAYIIKKINGQFDKYE